MASIVVSGDTSGAITISAPATAGTNTLSLPANTGTAILDYSTPAYRNRIINGAMMIDQRNAGASVTLDGNELFPVDRFPCGDVTDGSFTAQQVSDAPTGFVYSLKCTITSADTNLTTTQVAYCKQTIEGLNVADLAWGTANAATITLSFWVKSSLTGTFGGALRNSGATRSYPYSYTISAANTWEKKTITIAGDTSGTWLTTNGEGINVQFSLGAGPDRVGTAGAWNSNNNVGATGQVQVIGTNGATWQITGVQLEKGSTATSFDYRPYGTELALCQRYFYKLDNQMQLGVAAAYSSGNNFLVYQNPVQMRATPTLTNNSASGSLATNGTTPTWTTVSLGSYASINATPMTFDGSTTGGYAYSVRMTSGSISISAEL